jgi:hypothetical protein
VDGWCSGSIVHLSSETGVPFFVSFLFIGGAMGKSISSSPFFFLPSVHRIGRGIPFGGPSFFELFS